ncbi:hypothetical protein ACWD5R_36445 [Streptomyces sp. NPDC002514]|uniref:hypothetical protein n=1 Tax=Streptomyces sp. NPDC001270 TaxID=3364554 RepID=UPI0036A0C527
MLLDDLCELLPTSPSWYGLESNDYGMREVIEPNVDYEVPEVREKQNPAPLTTVLMLITAPAAVGKSTAAEYMSNKLKCPILDLSRLQVGDGTVDGMPARSFGIRKNARYQEALLESKATLIVDALDEAEVRSGQANFRAFVRGLAGAASQIVGGRPSLVVLSRAESSRVIQEIFDERKLPYCHFEIRPFGKEQSERYLERKVTDVYQNQEKEPLHLKHSRPYSKERDSLFTVLASAITPKREGFWEEPDVRDFLGYAPVLDVAAEYLAVDNFANLGNSAIGSTSREGFAHWDLVASVIDQLLAREQSKFVAQFQEVEEFQRHGSSALLSVLYTPEEQCARLLDYVEGMQLDLNLPASLPVNLRESYETAADTQLSNHPFLRGGGWFNVIFRDYVTARAQLSPSTSLEAAKRIRSNILSSDWKHSPMYGFFSHSLGKSTSSEKSACHSEDLGALYESFKSACEVGDRLLTSIGRAGNRLAAYFSIVRGSGAGAAPLQFLTHEGTVSIAFPRELSYANIWDVPEVILGGDRPSFKFGSSVYISCADLMVAARELQAYVDRGETPVVLNVRSLISEHVKIQGESSDVILLCDDHLSFPWSKYQRRLDLGGLAADAREQGALYLEFRRIVLRFKDAKDGEAAVYQPMMDNLVVGSNKRARTVLDYLQEIGCVKLARSMYLLDLASFAKLGVSRSQLRDLENAEAMGRISKDILRFAKQKS